MSRISPAAKAAQDAARRANGEFGNQHHSEPETALPSPAATAAARYRIAERLADAERAAAQASAIEMLAICRDAEPSLASATIVPAERYDDEFYWVTEVSAATHADGTDFTFGELEALNDAITERSDAYFSLAERLRGNEATSMRLQHGEGFVRGAWQDRDGDGDEFAAAPDATAEPAERLVDRLRDELHEADLADLDAVVRDAAGDVHEYRAKPLEDYDEDGTYYSVWIESATRTDGTALGPDELERLQERVNDTATGAHSIAERWWVDRETDPAPRHPRRA